MKKLIAFVLSIVSLSVLADTWTDPATGITWTYVINDGQAQVDGSYDLAISPATTDAIVIPETLGGCPVTSIGSYAFCNCRSLVAVSIPTSVTSIGGFAFLGCNKLTSVTISSRLMFCRNVFGQCEGLRALHILGDKPEWFDEVIAEFSESIEVYVQRSSRGWGDTIPSEIVTEKGLRVMLMPDEDWIDDGEVREVRKNGIDYLVFCENGCAEVVSCVSPPNGELVIPAVIGGRLVTCIGERAFEYSRDITSVTIPSSVTSIGNDAFGGCKLTSVTIPTGVQTIGFYAFYSCALTNLTVLSDKVRIGRQAFASCRSLTSVTLPESALVENMAFHDCVGLADSNGLVVVNNVLYDYIGSNDVVIPSGVTRISGDAFDWRDIKGALRIPSSVTSIGENAFRTPSTGGIGSVWVDDLRQFASIQFENKYSNPVTFAKEFYVAGELVTGTCTVTYVADYDGWFKDADSEYGLANQKTVEVEIGKGVLWTPEYCYGGELWRKIVGWQGENCVISDAVVRPVYGTPSLEEVLHNSGFAGRIGSAFDLFYYDTTDGTVHTEGAVVIGDNRESYFYELFASKDLYITAVAHDDAGHVICKKSRKVIMSYEGYPYYRYNIDGAWNFSFKDAQRKVRRISVYIESPSYPGPGGDASTHICDQYEPVYQVTFDLGDKCSQVSNVDLVQYVAEGGHATVPSVRTEKGWKWLGWSGDVAQEILGTTKFEVVCEPVVYSVDYVHAKGVDNPNPTTYTVTNEIVFVALPDKDDWHFDGWSPAKIDVGTTGDVTVTALWRPIEKAEIVGTWSEPQTFEYDGKEHGVDYSARLDVMDWPLNVVTQGTIRAVNVGEYAATARTETVGVPETDTVYYRCAAVTNDCRWTITPKPVTKLQITYVSTAMIASGQPQTPQIVVRDVERGVVLTATDYTLAYENNVEPGRGIARIAGKGNYGGEATIEFPIVATVSPSEGLNMDGGTFEIVGETDWVADNVETHDGYAAMRSGAIGDGEASALTSVVHGAGTVSFWWKVSSQRFDSVLELDRLEFYIDGERQKWINGDTPWAKLSYKVDGAGPHELKWVYVKDGSVSERQDCGWVDEVTWEKDWLIGDWLNDVDREFTTDEGDSLVTWVPDSSVSADGVGSMRSGACQQGERSVLSTVVENAGELTFKWKASCVAYGDYVTDKLSLLVDGVPAKDKDGKDIFVNGQTDWRDVSCRISGVGRHEVQWVFEKVSDASMGQNCGWVDVVRWNGEPGTLTDADLVVESFDGVYDGQGHGVSVSVKGTQGASVKYGASCETIDSETSPTFADCGENEVWFAVNVPEFYEYVGKAVVRIQPRSIETGTVTLGTPLVYTGAVQTQDVASVVVDGLVATFEVADNEVHDAGAYQLTVTGTGNFCGELSVPFAVGKAQASLKDVTVEGVSPDSGAVEFTYDGKVHQPTVVAGYDGSTVVRFSLSEGGPYVDELGVSNAVERLDIWYEIESANFERLVGQTRMTIHPLSIAGAEVVLGEQVSDAEGRVVQQVDSVIVAGLSATFEVADNVAAAEGDFELTVSGTGNFTGEAKCPYSVGGIVLPPVMTPGDGTVFADLVTVVFSNQTEGAKHYFTTNGANPDTSSLAVKRIRLNRKTTIKAISVLEGRLRSAMVEATYAFGHCQTPTVRLQGREGGVFNFPNQMVVVDWNEADGVLRYTVDGSDPTAESVAYEGPFAISSSTTVKAKVFSDRFFDSEVVTGDFRYERLTVAAPVIVAANEFTGTSTKVDMSCATGGAVIRYTLDGGEPTGDSAVYAGPLDIPCELGKSVEIKARAFCDGYDPSSIAAAEVRRIWGYGDALGAPDWQFASDEGDAAWFAVTNVTGEGEVALRSGAIRDGEQSSLKTLVFDEGTLTFNWMADTEDSSGVYDWDHAEFRVDGVPVAWIDGQWTGWITVECELSKSDHGHELEWAYVKDGMDSEWSDVVYLSNVRMSNGSSHNAPYVEGDEGATVTGDAETGFVIKPSKEKTAVEVTIPQGVDAAKVTVEVSPKVASVKLNGAKVKIVSGGVDITEYLDVPGTVGCDGGGAVATQEDAVIDLTKATVKEEFVKEVLDVEKGAVIDLCGGSQGTASPTITTAPTRVGLFYTFREGTTLEGFGTKAPSATKIGDGKPWSPEIKIKGGNSAFYSIGVGKGE